jgi:hypothetical protein
MKNNIIVVISSIILSFSLIFSAVYVSNTINKVSIIEVNNNSASQSLLMNSDEAAEYIGISVDTLISNIKRERIEKYGLNTYETYRFIPYLEIDGVMYFNKFELIKWAEYKTNNH